MMDLEIVVEVKIAVTQITHRQTQVKKAALAEHHKVNLRLLTILLKHQNLIIHK